MRKFTKWGLALAVFIMTIAVAIPVSAREPIDLDPNGPSVIVDPGETIDLPDEIIMPDGYLSTIQDVDGNDVSITQTAEYDVWKKEVNFVLNLVCGFALLTSIIVLAVNVVKVAGNADSTFIRHGLYVNLLKAMICISGIGAVRFITYLIFYTFL